MSIMRKSRVSHVHLLKVNIYEISSPVVISSDIICHSVKRFSQCQTSVELLKGLC